MPEKTSNRGGISRAARDQEAAKDKKHGYRREADGVPSLGQSVQRLDAETTQVKTVGEHDQNREDESQETESVILWVERFGEIVRSPVNDRGVG